MSNDYNIQATLSAAHQQMNLQQQQQQQQQPQQWTTADFIKSLDSLFSNETNKTQIIEYLEKNFYKQPALIGVLVDYYFENGTSSSQTISRSSSYLSPRDAYDYDSISSNSRTTILDLICKIPDDLVTKLYDKLNDKYTMAISASSASLTGNLSSIVNSQAILIKQLDKLTYLLVLLTYRKKIFLSKLITHSLFGNLIKSLKVSNNLNEQICTQTTLLFVAIMNHIPIQLLHTNLDNIFNIFVSLFKYISSLESQKLVNDDIIWSSLKWSIRLYFYVCYGLYTHQFVLFLRKMEKQFTNKELLISIFFYLRLHPSLLKDKIDTEKQYKSQIQSLEHDFSAEWRQYCLDPLVTNYNQIIENLSRLNPAQSTNIHTAFSGSVFSGFNSLSQPIVNHYEQHQLYNNMPLSPSQIFTSNNRYSKNITTNSQLFNSSVPTTPTPQLQQHFVFQYPPISDSNSKHVSLNTPSISETAISKQPIKNLTDQFMQGDHEPDHQTETDSSIIYQQQFLLQSNNSDLKFKLRPALSNKTNLLKHKSLSETNLFGKSSSSINLAGRPPINQAQTHQIDDHKHARLVKSDVRDANIKEPLSVFHKSTVNTTDSSTNTNDSDRYLSTTPGLNTNLAKSLESNDAAIRANMHSDILVKKLNQLVLQLIYERSLREKFEADSNRLSFIKSERDQLLIEKKNSENNVSLDEKFQKDVELSINVQNKTEINAYREELDEKNHLLENLEIKLKERDETISQLNLNYNELKSEYQRLQKDHANTVHQLEKELNSKIKNEIDYNYLKSLKHTTSLLRKKLLLMSKSQQTMVQTFNQEINELLSAQQINSNILFNNSQNQLQFDNNNTVYSQLTNLGLFQNQQNIIDLQQKEIDDLKLNYDKLLIKFKENEMELDNYKNKLKLSETKLEEVTQTLDMEVVTIKGELLKSHHRIQSSLTNVNKRLEEEIVQLNAKLNEQMVKNIKLQEQVDFLKNQSSQDLLNGIVQVNNSPASNTTQSIDHKSE